MPRSKLLVAVSLLLVFAAGPISAGEPEKAMVRSMTSTTISQDVYAFVFDQKGLMGGVAIQGSKITRIAK